MKGSAKTTLFDFVHLDLHKSKLDTAGAAASYPRASAAAAAAESAMKQIVLTGGGGRNRLVLELDCGNSETEADAVQTWFEVSYCMSMYPVCLKRNLYNVGRILFTFLRALRHGKRQGGSGGTFFLVAREGTFFRSL